MASVKWKHLIALRSILEDGVSFYTLQVSCIAVFIADSSMSYNKNKVEVGVIVFVSPHLFSGLSNEPCQLQSWEAPTFHDTASDIAFVFP